MAWKSVEVVGDERGAVVGARVDARGFHRGYAVLVLQHALGAAQPRVQLMRPAFACSGPGTRASRGTAAEGLADDSARCAATVV